MWSYARPFCEEADDDPPQYFQGRALPLSRLVVAILALRVLFRVCRPCVMAKQQPQRRARRLAAHLAFQMWFLATDLLARKCLCLADEGGWLGLGVLQVYSTWGPRLYAAVSAAFDPKPS